MITTLGGDDWDQIVSNWIKDEIKRQHGLELNDKMALQRFREAKIDLSGQLETTISSIYWYGTKWSNQF